MKIDHENRTITIRQSWLDTAQAVCPERARLAVVKPEWDVLDSDEALIGTATHYAIEQRLRGNTEDIGDLAFDWAMGNIDPDKVRWVKRSTVREIAMAARACAKAWEAEIFPRVPQGGHTEVTFTVPLFTQGADEYQVLLSGTVDYVLPNELWDWKTSSRDYKPWEKQRWAIQPTAYAYVASLGLLPHAPAMSTPIKFRYGVITKPRNENGKYTTDIVTVTRTQADFDWMLRRIKMWVTMGLRSLGHEWPMTDSENHLCSSTWCPWWVLCKGAHISEDQYQTPSQAL